MKVATIGLRRGTYSEAKGGGERTGESEESEFWDNRVISEVS